MQKLPHATLWIALAGPGVVAGVSLLAISHWDHNAVRLLFLAVFACLLASVLFRAHTIEGMSFSRLGFRKPNVVTLGLAAGLTTFFIFVFGPFAFWLVGVLGLGTFNDGIERLASVPTFMLALNILVVAAGEEWLYRCYAIERLEDLTGNVWFAGFLSLIAFALVHLPFWGPGPALTTLISGAVLTLAYIWTRDIVALIVAHLAVDFYGLILAV